MPTVRIDIFDVLILDYNVNFDRNLDFQVLQHSVSSTYSEKIKLKATIQFPRNKNH